MFSIAYPIKHVSSYSVHFVVPFALVDRHLIDTENVICLQKKD